VSGIPRVYDVPISCTEGTAPPFLHLSVSSSLSVSGTMVSSAARLWLCRHALARVTRPVSAGVVSVPQRQSHALAHDVWPAVNLPRGDHVPCMNCLSYELVLHVSLSFRWTMRRITRPEPVRSMQHRPPPPATRHPTHLLHPRRPLFSLNWDGWH
jgi:hypothetical protein